jgi:hypothetical protein
MIWCESASGQCPTCGQSCHPCFVDGDGWGGVALFCDCDAPPQTAFGEAFRAARLDADLTLREAAERIGTTFVDVSHVETGRRVLSAAEEVDWANMVGMER